MSEARIYDELWRNSAPQLARGDVRVDLNVGSDEDPRRGLTVIYRPDAVTRAAFAEFVARACAVEPTLYAYPAADMHTTVLSLISCEPDFEVSADGFAAYARVVRSCLSAARPFVVRYQGLTATEDGIMAQGFVEEDRLNALRDSMRAAFASAALRTTMDARYRLETAHTTLLRFAARPESPAELHELVSEHRSRNFGQTRVGNIELVVNDWYMTTEKLGNTETYRLC